jgi:hypothetical protein
VHLLAVVLAQHAPLASAATNQGSGSSMLPLEIILVVIGIIIGRIWGRRAGLKHLGEAEFRARWGLVRRHRRW